MCCNDEDDYWDCPTCGRPTPPETDYECECCGQRASHHISVTAMCKIIREWQLRAHRAEKELAEHVLRSKTWPHDTNPFDSQDHDNDSKTYQ
jgi:hypothetical protein